MRTTILFALMASCLPAVAAAQTDGDVVIMRRTIAPPTRTPPTGATPTPTPTPTPTLEPAHTYEPVVGQYGEYSSFCALSASQTRTNSCLRQPGATTVAVSYCGLEETETRYENVFSGCTGTWRKEAGACTGGTSQGTVTCDSVDDKGNPTCDPRTKPTAGSSSCAFSDGFDKPIGIWTSSGLGTATYLTASDAKEGAGYVRLSNGGGKYAQFRPYQNITVSGSQIEASVWVRSSDGKPYDFYFILTDQATYKNLTEQRVTISSTSWQRLHYSGPLPSKMVMVVLQHNFSPGAGVDIDDIKILTN